MLLLVCSQLHYWFIRDINSNCRYYTDDNYHSWYWRMICCYTLLTMYHRCWLEMTLTDGEISPLCCVFTALWLCLMSRWAWASPHQNVGQDEELKPIGLQCISNNAASVSNPYWPKYIYTSRQRQSYYARQFRTAGRNVCLIHCKNILCLWPTARPMVDRGSRFRLGSW